MRLEDVQKFFSQVQCDPGIVLADCQAIIDNYTRLDRPFRVHNVCGCDLVCPKNGMHVCMCVCVCVCACSRGL
jgi:hypothetical protein